MKSDLPQPVLADLLVIGYGNVLRRDDGVGPKVAAAVEALSLDGVQVLACHQLTPELAEPISRAGLVIFVDAVVGDERTFEVLKVTPDYRGASTTHAADPAALLGLARQLYGSRPRAWWIAIPVSDTDFGEALSASAMNGMSRALAEIEEIWKRRREQNPGRDKKTSSQEW